MDELSGNVLSNRSYRLQSTAYVNAFVERFNRSIKEECLDRVIPLGEAHLRELVREYVTHYHEERPHQGLSSRLIAASTDRGRGPLARRQRLGGLLNHYYREAA